MATPPRLSVVPLAVLFAVTACTSGADSGGYENGTIQVSASARTFSSLDELTTASELVIVGTVVEIGEANLEGAPAEEDFVGHQYLSVTIRIDETLKGEIDAKQIDYRTFGYDVKGDGTKGPQWIVDGIEPPKIGEQSLWFLVAEAALFGYYGTPGVEGRVSINEDGTLTPVAPYDSGAAKELEETDIDTLRADRSTSDQ